MKEETDKTVVLALHANYLYIYICMHQVVSQLKYNSLAPVFGSAFL